jgi:hypothetical protein
MTALLHDDVVPALPASPPALPASPLAQARAKRPRHRQMGAGGDPLADAAAHLLSIPLRHVYAVLWRVGLIEVTA